MIARARPTWGARVYIDTDDLERARRHGRTPIYMRNREGGIGTRRRFSLFEVPSRRETL